MPKLTELVKRKQGQQNWKYSTFFVTINPNKTEFDSQRLRSMMDKLFSDDDMFYGLFKSQNKNSLDPNDEASIDKSFTTVEYTIEKGPKLKRAHVHFQAKLRHRTHLHFNTQVLTLLMNKALDIPQGENVYVKIKASGNSDKTLKDYMTKPE
jgi:hypothetical protein